MTEKTIELIAIDLDGTLLDSKHQLPERNVTAIKAAIAQGVKIVLATGKTRYSARDIIQRLDLTTPGIYMQGLSIYDGSGNITFEQNLDPVVARQIITFAEDRGFDIMIYSRGRILVRNMTKRFEELTGPFHEPTPEAIGPLQNILGEIPINKIIINRSGDHRKITALRWQLSKQVDGQARLMQATIPDMLEVLPPNASKGHALRVLLKQMGINAENVMAIGDGENDIDMLNVAGIGVAVGNADQILKDVANHVTGSSDDAGVAQAIEQFVLKKPLEAEKAAVPEKAASASIPSPTSESSKKADGV